MEQNVTKTPEWSNDLAHFHVEELEERFENCWQGKRKDVIPIEMDDCTIVNKEVLVDC